MSRTFYPSDEYDSHDLEREMSRRVRRWHQWFGNTRRDDDDDDPPPSPVAAPRPRPIPPLPEAQAA